MTAPREFLLADQPDSKNRAIILDTFGNVVATVESRADAVLLLAKPAPVKRRVNIVTVAVGVVSGLLGLALGVWTLAR